MSEERIVMSLDDAITADAKASYEDAIVTDWIMLCAVVRPNEGSGSRTYFFRTSEGMPYHTTVGMGEMASMYASGGFNDCDDDDDD